jgi:perosamine synthetase
MNIPLVKPSLDEEEVKAVSDAIRSTWINEGALVKEFENKVAEYSGAEHGIAFFNGTVALHAALAGLGIGPGDEVIVPSFTFFSTVSSVVHAGASPVFADVSPDDFGLDPSEIERRITPKTRGVIPVHYGGCPAHMDPIVAMSESRGIAVIEDAAESLGAVYEGRKAGSFGQAGMFSFTPSKAITTGEGGIVVTHDGALAGRLRLLKNHGQDRQYHHVCFGFNYRMTEMQAAMGLSQLKKLPSIIAQKRKVAFRISEELRDVRRLKVPSEPLNRVSTYTMYTVILESKALRDHLMAELQNRGITTRIYFPPVHLQPVFSGQRTQLPVTERLGETSLSLPCYASMTEREIDYLTSSIRQALRGF